MTSHHTVDKQYLLPLAKSLVPANPDPGRLNHFLPVSKGGGALPYGLQVQSHPLKISRPSANTL